MVLEEDDPNELEYSEEQGVSATSNELVMHAFLYIFITSRD